MTGGVGESGSAPGSEPGLPLEKGRLLVATPQLLDPHFDHTVVLLLDHDEEGTLGVVLNRPTGVGVSTVLTEWSEQVDGPPVLFEGGPVSPDAALALAAIAGDGPADPVGFRRIFGATGVMDLDTPRELLDPRVVRLRIFAGYAGWGSGQLLAEVEEGSWHVVDSAPGDAFCPNPEKLWAEVLRRQPGSLAWASTRPSDPTLN
jgi:putative transcriptional regulator